MYEDSCLCHRTRMASRAVTRFYDEMLRSTGLRATQLAVLVAVGRDEVFSITTLAKFIGMDRSTLTRNLAPLKREGLIRVGSEGWRRSRTVEMTKKRTLTIARGVAILGDCSGDAATKIG